MWYILIYSLTVVHNNYVKEANVIEKKEIGRMRLVHTGKVLCNLCIFGAVFLLLTGAMPVLSVLWYALAGLVFVVLFFFKLITFWQAPYDLEPIVDFLFGNTDTVFSVYGKLAVGAPYVFALTVAFAAAAIALIAVFDKYKRKGRIIAASVALGISCIGMILIYCVTPGVIA